MHTNSTVRSLWLLQHKFLQCSDLQELLTTLCESAIEFVSVQTASVFLFAKDGRFTRKIILGFDRDGNSIRNDWFKDESYQVGNSFTGKIVVSSGDLSQGSVHWSNNLSVEDLDTKSREAYVSLLGILSSAAGIPLNGQNTIYGVLEVINRLNASKQATLSGFSDDDILVLTVIGTSFTIALSRFQYINQLDTLAFLSRVLAEPHTVKRNQNHVYQEIIEWIVSEFTNYKVCILRINRQEHKKLEIVAREGNGIEWENRFDEPIGDERRFARTVFENKKHVIIVDITSEINDFKNKIWIEANDLHSFACFPLVITDKVVGTLSVYTGYRYHFYPSDVSYLQSVASLIASYVEGGYTIKQLRETRRELKRIKDSQVSAARDTASTSTIQTILHDVKHVLQRLERMLNQASETNSANRRLQLIESTKGEIKKAIEKFAKDMEIPQQVVDINKLIHKIVNDFKKELKTTDDDIEFWEDYSDQVPLVEVLEAEIKELAFNLISNAIKAIQHSDKRDGIVRVSTSVIDSDIDYIEIKVEDNGIGIKREVSEQIFERGFSTYEGGTGVGLYIVRNIVDSYGGSIDFESTVGKGTTFAIHIPKKRYAI